MSLSLKHLPRFPPRRPRVAITIASTLLLPDESAVAAIIRNISNQGFMAQSEAPLQPDIWVGVALPGIGIVRAQVRWIEDGEIGAQFKSGLNLGLLHDDYFSRSNGRPLFESRLL